MMRIVIGKKEVQLLFQKSPNASAENPNLYLTLLAEYDWYEI